MSKWLVTRSDILNEREYPRFDQVNLVGGGYPILQRPQFLLSGCVGFHSAWRSWLIEYSRSFFRLDWLFYSRLFSVGNFGEMSEPITAYFIFVFIICFMFIWFMYSFLLSIKQDFRLLYLKLILYFGKWWLKGCVKVTWNVTTQGCWLPLSGYLRVWLALSFIRKSCERVTAEHLLVKFPSDRLDRDKAWFLRYLLQVGIFPLSLPVKYFI